MSTGICANRHLIKISGEALAGREPRGVDSVALDDIGHELLAAAREDVEIAVVVGGGNFMRGGSSSLPMKRLTADYVGMLATVMNGLYLEQWLVHHGIDTEIFSAIPLDSQIRRYSADAVVQCLHKRQVVVLAGGTGNPYFTTDTTAALRGLELGAASLIKATNVDGIYDADPATDVNASRYRYIDYDTAMVKNLKIMDAAAFALCREHNLPIRVVNLGVKGNLQRAVKREDIGTLVARG